MYLSFFAKNIALISVLAPQMALLGFFHRVSSCSDKLIYIAFFPWLGVDPTEVLHLKEGPHGTHHHLNITMVKKMKKKKRKANRKIHFAMARIRTHENSRYECFIP